MMLARNTAVLSVAGFLIALTGSVDGARPKAKQQQTHMISGMVVNHQKKPVAGAHVHVMHHRKQATAAAAGQKAKAAKAVKPKAAAGKAHHGIMTGANGTFSMKHHHSGTVMLVAHKKHVGTGHARVTMGKGGTAHVMIRLHHHHHHHS
jgi:hypothetical protein